MKALARSLFLFGNSPSSRDAKECKWLGSSGDDLEWGLFFAAPCLLRNSRY